MQDKTQEQNSICTATVTQEGAAKWNVAFEWKDGAFCVPGEYKLYAAPEQAAPAAVAVPDEREAFEAWAREYGTWDVERDDVQSIGIASYTDVALVVAWHAWQARAALDATPAAPADPMDWPLPCDVTVGHGTIGKGVKLSMLVLRMKALYQMATGDDADEVAARTPEQRAQLFLSKMAATPAADQVNCDSLEQLNKNNDLAAAAPVVLPEPDEQVKEVMVLVGKYGSAVEANSTGNPSNYTLASDESAAYEAIKSKLRALLATATGLPAQAAETVDFPSGAILNGRANAERLETYGFECEAGALSLCSDWQEFRRCFEFLAEWVSLQAPQAQADVRDAFGFSPMYLAPLDGTPVLLYLPTTNDKFAVGQWHGHVDTLEGNWGDDEGNFYVHAPVAFMSLRYLSSIADKCIPEDIRAAIAAAKGE